MWRQKLRYEIRERAATCLLILSYDRIFIFFFQFFFLSYGYRLMAYASNGNILKIEFFFLLIWKRKRSKRRNDDRSIFLFKFVFVNDRKFQSVAKIKSHLLINKRLIAIRLAYVFFQEQLIKRRLYSSRYRKNLDKPLTRGKFIRMSQQFYL